MFALNSPRQFAAPLLLDTLNDLTQQALLQPCRELCLPSGDRINYWNLDQVSTRASGNKFFKQALYWLQAQTLPDRPLLSFGGAYSNHLYALAQEASVRKRQLIAVVRGLHKGSLNPCLQDIADTGARIRFVSREDYRRKESPDFLATLAQEYGPFITVPEGGGGILGAWGAQAIGLAAAQQHSSRIYLAAGTGSTAAGVLAGLDMYCRQQLAQGIKPQAKQLNIVPVINVAQDVSTCELVASIRRLRQELAELNAGHFAVDSEVSVEPWIQWRLCDGYQFGGYAKFPPALKAFMHRFETQHKIQLDPVYTAKVMACLNHQLLGDGYLECVENAAASESPCQERLFIHSGGLQGRRGFGLC